MRYNNSFKVVFTGGPCSGKSSVLNLLQLKGMKVVSEVGRKVLEESGRHPDYQREIFEKQLLKEENLEKGIHFLDRGAIDCIAYLNVFKDSKPFSYDLEDLKKRYKVIFVFERLPLEHDEIRKESEEEAEKVHRELISVYEKLDYQIVHVPCFEGSVGESIDKRINFILNYLGENHGLH